jgi:carbonic anhydrase/acetyltransferase-like protein (isoleucine patch superfamily)
MLIRHRGIEPTVDPSAYVAPTATVVGDVRIGPRARVMFGAVIDAEGAFVEVGDACVISEHAVLRATAVGIEAQPVVLSDHVFVGPHATLLGCRIERCCYLAANATVVHGARLGSGAVIAVGALVHAGAVLAPEMFVPPMTIAIGDPARVLTPDRTDDVVRAIQGVNFAATGFGVEHDWTDRIGRYEKMAEVRVQEYSAHSDDEIVS